MTPDIINNLLTNLFVWSYKIACLIIGYLFAKLGYRLFLKGVTGHFKFHSEIKGIKADLVSASPGTFFILMGTIIIAVTLYRGLSVEDIPLNPPQRQTINQLEGAYRPKTQKPTLPPTPPKEGDNASIQRYPE